MDWAYGLLFLTVLLVIALGLIFIAKSLKQFLVWLFTKFHIG